MEDDPEGGISTLLLPAEAKITSHYLFFAMLFMQLWG